jgi:sulfate adenylyltransferase large subunit
MTAHPNPDTFAIDEFLRAQEDKSLLRFIACGSVDHGKSSLLGRLLYESNLLFEDQLTTLRNDSKRHGAADNELDYSLLLDGLAAEREQKITIDVAYRFFSTAKRKFIVIDAPGHEQYTRNMATGASNADLALLLVDAQAGFTAQTRRHALLVAMLGVKHLVLAVNKMDLVGWSHEAFAKIEENFRNFAAGLDVENIIVIPLSARGGDNVVQRSTHTPWYQGPTLLDHLENVSLKPAARYQPLRMPVQWVNRPDANFRGYCGTIASGEAFPGMPVKLLPSGQTTKIAAIVTADGDLARAGAGQAVTLTLQTEVDASRGDVIVEDDDTSHAASQIKAQIFWMADEALQPGRRLLAKAGAATAQATVGSGLTRTSLDTLESSPVGHLAPNEIGHCQLTFDRPLTLERYKDNRDLGSFILIDAETNDTVAMGLITELGSAETKAETALSRLRALAQNAFSKRPGADAGVTHPRSFAKALSWRAIGSLTTFTLVWLLTGSTVIATAVAAAEIIVKVAIYYMHERAWLSVSWGRQQRVG